MNRQKKWVISLIIALIFLINCGSGASPGESSSRPAHWAEKVEVDGLPNLYKVSAALYRGAQPGKQGIEALKKLGIKTIVNFRTSNYDQEMIKGYSFNYYHLPMIAFFPSKEKYSRFLKIVSDPDKQPVFVHCKHGADRTGAAAALYRIKIQNWPVEEAIEEMINGGYHFHKIHNHLKRFVRKF